MGLGDGMKLRLGMKDESIGQRCENCGRALTAEAVYTREIDGSIHYFCCSHCADSFEGNRSQHCC